MYYKTVTHISTTRVRDRYEGGRPVVWEHGESEEVKESVRECVCVRERDRGRVRVRERKRERGEGMSESAAFSSHSIIERSESFS